MAIRMMGLESQVKKGDFVLPIAVDAYARPYVELAIEHGLINPSEEEDSSGKAQKTSWGAREATREWVAKIVIRAIGKEAEAMQMAANPSPFKDSNDASPWASGYINEAFVLKIVNGLDDNNFGPKGPVTRAQMAAFLSRADKYLTSRPDNVKIGYVMEITDRKISVQDEKGELSEYAITSDTVIYNAKDDSRITASSIKLTNEVYVVASRGNAYYIELTNDQEHMESIEGTLSKVFLEQMAVAFVQNGTDKYVELAPNVTVTDQDGHGLSISSIPLGSKIELKRSLLVKNAKISQIVVKEVPVSKKSEGTIMNPKDEANNMVFLEQSTGKQESFAVSSRISVINADGSIGEFSKLRTGDIVAYEIVNNEVVSVTVKKAADFGQTVKGTLTSISPDKTIITISKTGNSLGAYYLAENAIVSIEGLTNAGLYDLEVGDEVTLDLLNEKVVKVSVTNRTINNVVFASIVSFDPDLKILTVQGENGIPSAYKLTDTTAIYIGDTTVPYNNSNFATLYAKGKRVDLKASKDKLTSIRLSSVLEGTVTQINSTANPNEITVRVGSGQNLTFKLNSGASFDVLGKGLTATIGDVKVGDTVKATLNYTQDMISQVVVKKAAIYKVLFKNDSERQISVKDDSGALSVFKIDNDGKIVKVGQAAASFNDIALDEYVKLEFSGNTLDKVTLLDSVRGKVTGVDAATGTITVQDYNNAVQVIPVGQNFVIKLNGTTSAALTSIKPNDRVEVIKNADDKYVINVATAAKRVVASYDYVLNQLVLKPNSANDKTTYSFFAKAYVHKGNTAVAPSAFVENDEIMIYVLDDKIVEIEK